ncbi:hypothetical protein JHK87_004161 [Glycine soja]|nr:hypothetical protein JHK87_004161 [Glycine soja]
MVVLLALSLFMPRGGAVIVVLSMVFVTWSARVRNKLLGLVTRWDEHLGLVGYACFLVYSLFSLLPKLLNLDPLLDRINPSFVLRSLLLD